MNPPCFAEQNATAFAGAEAVSYTHLDNGIITLKDGAGLEATVNDIAENPHNVKIEELAAEQVARVAPEVAFVVLNGNYALQAGYSVAQDSLAYETSDSEAAKTYVNVIAVKEGNENNPGIQALVKVLKSDDIKKFINDTYDLSLIHICMGRFRVRKDI